MYYKFFRFDACTIIDGDFFNEFQICLHDDNFCMHEALLFHVKFNLLQYFNEQFVKEPSCNSMC